jgi:hypothetical protein
MMIKVVRSVVTEQIGTTMTGLLEILAFRSEYIYLSNLHQPRFLLVI